MNAKGTASRYAKSRDGKPSKLILGEKAMRGAGRIVPLATIRRKELDRLFTDKFGRALPDSELGRLAAKIMLDHIAYSRAADRQWLMHDWLDRRAPWIAGEERDELIRAVFRHPIRYEADTIADKVGVTYARRERLGLTVIGSIDVRAKARKELRAEKDRARKRAARRKAGCMSRSEYENQAISRLKPWEMAGVSRATWHRRQKNAKSHYAADTLVSPIAYAVMTMRCR